MSDKKQDNRSVGTHLIHGIGHTINGKLKDQGFKGGIESTGVYRKVSPNKNNGKSWSREIDQQRADYHFKQASEKFNKKSD